MDEKTIRLFEAVIAYLILLYFFYDKNKVSGNFIKINYEFIIYSISVLFCLPTKYKPEKDFMLYSLRFSFWVLILAEIYIFLKENILSKP